tara:strand:- start:921 stop:1067 length:147 start_codon:yes stop_codon:yes gene_type:complete
MKLIGYIVIVILKKNKRKKIESTYVPLLGTSPRVTAFSGLSRGNRHGI